MFRQKSQLEMFVLETVPYQNVYEAKSTLFNAKLNYTCDLLHCASDVQNF